MIVIKTPAEKLSKQGQAGAKLLAKQGQTSKTILSSDKISKGIWKSNNIDNKIHASYYENNIFFISLEGSKCCTYHYKEAGVILSNTNLQTFRTQKTNWKLVFKKSRICKR